MAQAGSFQTQIINKQSFLGHIEHVLSTIKYPSQSTQGSLSQTIPVSAPLLDPMTLSALFSVVATIQQEKKIQTEELKIIIALYLFEVAKTQLPPEDRARYKTLVDEQRRIAASQEYFLLKTIENTTQVQQKKPEDNKNDIITERLKLAKELEAKVEMRKMFNILEPRPTITGEKPLPAETQINTTNINKGPAPPASH